MHSQDRVLGGLWGAIIGDALGVPVEFTSRESCRRNPGTGMRGYGTHHQPLGTWSDDSSLLLCTVEALHMHSLESPSRCALVGRCENHYNYTDR